MKVQTADEARALFQKSSLSLESVLIYVAENAEDNMRCVAIEGWLGDAVVEELKQRGFSVDLEGDLMPETRITW